MEAARCAWLSIPTGKIMRTVSVLICFHARDGGLPPNCWECVIKGINVKSTGINNFRMGGFFMKVTGKMIPAISEQTRFILSLLHV